MIRKSKKKIIEKRYKQGFIPESLFSIINNDIEEYLEMKVIRNQTIIEEMITLRKSLGLEIYFSKKFIINEISATF